MGAGQSKRSYNVADSASKNEAHGVQVEGFRSSSSDAAQSTSRPASVALVTSDPPPPIVVPTPVTATIVVTSATDDKPQDTAEAASEMGSASSSEAEAPVPADRVQATLCKRSDLENGQMREFEVEGTKVLLVKDGDQFFAVGSKCTHYGAPLAKGTYANGRVRCPWHGACFSVETGDIEDFPGLDCIPKFEVSVSGDDVVLSTTKTCLTQSKRVKSMTKADTSSDLTCVIVGGGAAAMSCAQTLRQEGFTGKIEMLSQEEHYPYDRPKLSKSLDAKIEVLQLRPAEFFTENNITVKLRTRVTSVDIAARAVKTEDGETVRYNSLVLATGGAPRTLTCPGAELENVCYLRTPTDGQKIARLAEGKRVVVIGSSFIGMEMTSVIAKKAGSVLAIDLLECPFQLVLGKELGFGLRKLFESHDVQFRMGVGVKELRGDADGKLTEIVLSDDSVVPADVAIVGIGVVPATDFLQNSGLTINQRGFVVVDEFMRTNDPNVYACGDIVSFPLSSFAGQSTNIQHWQMALKHGTIAALSICGKSQPCRTVPFFWTVLFGKSLRYTGCGHGFDDVVLHGSLEEMKFVAYFLKADKVIAVGAIGRDPIVSQIADLFLAGKAIGRADVERNQTDDWSKF